MIECSNWKANRHSAGQQMTCKFGGFHGGNYEDAVSSDVMPLGSCRSRSFVGTYNLHLQGESNQRGRNTLAATSNSIFH
jgi:hypothetical protein